MFWQLSTFNPLGTTRAKPDLSSHIFAVKTFFTTNRFYLSVGLTRTISKMNEYDDTKFSNERVRNSSQVLTANFTISHVSFFMFRSNDKKHTLPMIQITIRTKGFVAVVKKDQKAGGFVERKAISNKM